MIKAAIFDMDGLLIDSEPIWTEAATEVMQKVNFKLTHDLKLQTTGLSIKLFLEFCYRIQPWNTPNRAELEHEILTIAHKNIIANAKPMPGAIDLIKNLHAEKIKLAVASASHMELIEAVLRRLEIIDYFDTWHSGELEEHTKPHPAVYISTAAKLGVPVHECIAFEDSFTGLRSAYAAKMITICVPTAEVYNDPKFDLAHYKLHSLEEFDILAVGV
ncbi:hexitol phosphatase HxpB [Dyadobacter frigoris]|uniref:Hexitol phosphatase HxpB n=1 Tax=Dyadobacter frigoris TaxID=2576211 RepID=A0A4U6D656_9BACT|nr:hexitol phosphatase HxpB [Dyadobacter frigoris]TKT91721.1 hexitol phosphatase HxpB [Dyadobacter frigoris]GLU51711.1 2-deoxyglucose-6-phosphatase [Dyadobacter frigoris]